MKRTSTKSVTEAVTKTTPAKTEKVTEKATKTTKRTTTRKSTVKKEVKELQFDSGNLRITMDRKTLKEIEKRISADVYLEIRKADKDILTSFKQLPENFKSACTTAANSDFIRKYIPDAILNIYCNR